MENYVAATAYYIVIGYNLASLLQEKSTINICIMRIQTSFYILSMIDDMLNTEISRLK